MSIDKLAPQAVEAEQSVLGSILIDPDAILKVAEFLRPADFYRQQHSDIYEAMLGLHGQREPIDLVTLGEELDRRDRLEPVGGPAYLASPHEHGAHRGPRRALRAHRRAQGGAAQPDRARPARSRPSATRRRTTPRSPSIGPRASCSRSASTAPTAASSRWPPCWARHMTGSSTCTSIAASSWASPPASRQLDALLGGFQPSDLIIVAARPSVGKTSLALNIAQHAAVREGKKVGLFSLEMSKEQLALRLLSAESGINPRPLQSGFVDETDWSKIAQVMNDMHAAPMWIDDSPVLTVMELRTKARRLEAEQRGLDLIIVDYLQLMQGIVSPEGARIGSRRSARSAAA